MLQPSLKKIRKVKENPIVFINSVCGCAAGKARPGLLESLSFLPKDVIVSSVFAGVDDQSTQAVREYAVGIAPSSPSICFFIGTNLVHFVSRQTIEGASANLLSLYLRNVYEKFFNETVNTDMPIPTPQELVEIEVGEAKKLLEKKSAQFFDCRSSEEREIEKIEGDTHMTLELSKSILAEKEKNAQSNPNHVLQCWGQVFFRCFFFSLPWVGKHLLSKGWLFGLEKFESLTKNSLHKKPLFPIEFFLANHSRLSF